MKHLAILSIILLALIASACGGGSSSSGNINGNWAATLSDPSNNTGPDFAFTTSFTQTSGSGINIVNLKFTTEESCFGTSGTETGSFGFAGDFNGNVTGTFAMTIQSAAPSGNTLTLNGNVSNNTVTGNWVLTGTGCNGSGTFSMTKM